MPSQQNAYCYLWLAASLTKVTNLPWSLDIGIQFCLSLFSEYLICQNVIVNMLNNLFSAGKVSFLTMQCIIDRKMNNKPISHDAKRTHSNSPDAWHFFILFSFHLMDKGATLLNRKAKMQLLTWMRGK